MKYRYRVWCPDCYCEDPDGCFDGGYENSEETYDTPEQAYDGGVQRIKDTIYRFEVIDDLGNKVEVPA